jgi:ParB family transcriptional regulator, chromosome partitioning protein
MTSGHFHSIRTEQIAVFRGERQRKSLGKLEDLIDSIRRLGLIHPIVVTRDNALVAGERRLAACRALGHDYINCQYVDELDESTLKAIELEENIKRLNIEWQDECVAIDAYHRLRKSRDPDWSEEKTADAIGYGRQTINSYLHLAHEGKSNDSIFKIPEVSTALNKLRREKERRDAAIREGVFGAPEEEKEKSVLNKDFIEWALTYEGPKFNFLHCDFPYGIDADKRHQGSSVDVHGGYDDSAETYWLLLDALCASLNRICTESAHIMFWFSMRYYADTLDFFANHSDFVIDPFPLVWLKSDGVGLLPDPQRGPRRIYETCLFGARGDRKIVSSVANAYAAPTDRRQHMSTKPEPVLRHFFRMFVDENSTVLDPTCGSGSALRAAESLGAARILGIEINEDFTERANLDLEVARRMNAV